MTHVSNLAITLIGDAVVLASLLSSLAWQGGYDLI